MEDELGREKENEEPKRMGNMIVIMRTYRRDMPKAP